MRIDNELLYFLNKLNFDELVNRKYSSFEKEGFPFLWIKDNRLILPKPKVSFMLDLKKHKKESFLPDSLDEIGGSLQKRLFTNYFIPATQKEDIHWNFFGFLGFNLNNEFYVKSRWYNSPSQIDAILPLHNLGLKTYSQKVNDLIFCDTDEISIVSELDSKLETFEKYSSGLKELFKKDLYRKILDGKATISRYHPPEEQLNFIRFFESLEPISAKNILDKISGDFFKAYVGSPC